MIKYLGHLFLAVVVITSGCKKKTDDSTEPQPENSTVKTLSGQPPLVIGHRGAPGYMPDHTLEGYRLAIELNADFIEPDLVLTKDCVLICRHEPVLSGTTNVASIAKFADRKTTRTIDGVEYKDDFFAQDFTSKEIEELRAIQPLSSVGRSTAFDGLFKIPTFQEVINLAKSYRDKGRNIGIYPETKHPTFHEEQKLPLTDKVLEALDKAGWNNKDAPVFLQSFEVGNLQYVRNTKKSTIRIVQLYDANDVKSDGTMDMAAPYGQPYDFVKSGDKRTYNDLITDAGLDFVKTYADGIGPWKPYVIPVYNNKRMMPTDLIVRAHKKGLLVHLYTFRNEAKYLADDYKGDPKVEYKDFYSLGVDGVFSDYPGTAVASRP